MHGQIRQPLRRTNNIYDSDPDLWKLRLDVDGDKMHPLTGEQPANDFLCERQKAWRQHINFTLSLECALLPRAHVSVFFGPRHPFPSKHQIVHISIHGGNNPHVHNKEEKFILGSSSKYCLAGRNHTRRPERVLQKGNDAAHVWALQTCTFNLRALAVQTPPKFHEKTPKRRKKE